MNFQQAKIVKKIFNWYLDGKSVIGIVKEIEKENIKSPTGKNKWPKRSIETMLENEKYTGSVKLLDSVNKENYYLLKDKHEAIIAEDVFNKVQEARKNNTIQRNRIKEISPSEAFVPVTEFKCCRAELKFDDPYKQAEYVYSLIREG